MLSLVFRCPDLVKSEFECSVCEFGFSWEVLNVVDRGFPIGVNDFAEDGGGPAGVVETLLQRLCFLSFSGVKGDCKLLENENDIVRVNQCSWPERPTNWNFWAADCWRGRVVNKVGRATVGERGNKKDK